MRYEKNPAFILEDKTNEILTLKSVILENYYYKLNLIQWRKYFSD